MITLALDTSTTRGAVALLRDGHCLAEEHFTRDGLFAALAKLNPGPLDAIVVGVGPGSFTGIRAGIAAAKGLALPRATPVHAGSSFDALALTALPQMPADCARLCVLSDARRNEVYFALYDRQGLRQGEHRLGALENLADEIHDPIWFVSAEMDRFRSALTETLGGFALVCPEPMYPSAARLTSNRLPLEPLYLRPTEYKKTTT